MRLFFGLPLPPRVREATRAYAARAALSVPGRYALAENHHLTLAFLGEVKPERVPDARAVLAVCARAFPAPRVTLTGPAHFGRPENAIFILRAQASPDLAPLHDALIRALQDAGLPHDPGPFSPHVTLARHARMTEGEAPAFTPVEFTAERAHVFWSARDEKDILRYTPIGHVEFK